MHSIVMDDAIRETGACLYTEAGDVCPAEVQAACESLWRTYLTPFPAAA